MYLLCVVGLLNSQNLIPAFFDFEQKLPLLTLPLIFAMGTMIDEQKRSQIQMAFVMGTLIICLLNYRNGFYWVYSSPVEIAEKNLLIGRPYLGMYCVFCIFFCLKCFRICQDRWQKIATFFLVCFFFFFLLTLFAKMAFATLATLIFIYLLIELFKREKYLILGIGLTVTIAGVAYGAFLTGKGKEITTKALSFTEFDWINYDPQWVNSVNLRFIKWKCAAEVLAQNKNWLWGVGTGDTQQLLDNCYTAKLGADSFFVTEHYNSHNQYFTTWLNQGLISLIFLLLHFGFFLRHHYLTKNTLGIIFTIGVMMFCITESIFEVQKGIVFYTFFQLLLYKSKYDIIVLRATNHEV